MRAVEFITEEIKIDHNARAKAWIEKVYAEYPQTWQNNHIMVMGGTGDDQQFAMFELVPSMSKKDAVEVKWFQAYPLRQGVGSRAMQQLQTLAREDGIALTLYPWDKGQVSQAKLTKFYKGQGFKPTVKGAKNMMWSPETVLEDLENNGISFQVQKGKNKFATTLSVGSNPVGIYQYDANTGRSIAEIYPEFKGKGLGKLLVLHAIYTAAKLGLDFQEDESRTSEYDNVLDSLSSSGYIVDDDGYWYVTGEGEQFLKQSLKQGVAEGVPQPGPSSGAPKQFGPDAKIQTRQMTVKDIISSVPGVPYYNNVVDDWDAKDYNSWNTTEKVIEYATYLKDHPESLAKLPPIIVLNGKFEDGAHRVSAIWLLQQRMDPKNPLWANAKLNVQFVKQGVAENFLDEGLRVDVPNEEWLQDAIDYAKQKSPDRNGLPYMGKTTATVRSVDVPVDILKRIPGMRREQQNVRQADLAAIIKIMSDTGKLPLGSHTGEEYKPFINVAYDGSAWVNEGNHRIMAAAKLGWKTLPVEISYFDGGERVKDGAMYPGRIGLGDPQLDEAFDQPYKGKWEKSDYGDVDMLAKLPDGSNLSIMFNQEYGDEGEEVTQVEFYRNNSQAVTGEGDAQRIFATVLDSIQKYIKKYKPQKLSFSASKEVGMDADDNGAQFNPESRAKLYDRLVQRYSKALGYRAFRADNSDIVIYELSRLKSTYV
jgi:GNAT superfamily N-acetyltransferase